MRRMYKKSNVLNGSRFASDYKCLNKDRKQHTMGEMYMNLNELKELIIENDRLKKNEENLNEMYASCREELSDVTKLFKLFLLEKGQTEGFIQFVIKKVSESKVHWDYIQYAEDMRDSAILDAIYVERVKNDKTLTTEYRVCIDNSDVPYPSTIVLDTFENKTDAYTYAFEKFKDGKSVGVETLGIHKYDENGEVDKVEIFSHLDEHYDQIQKLIKE